MKQRYCRRGTIYVMALSCGLLITVIGMSAVLSIQVRERGVQDGWQHASARSLAQSGIELGRQLIASNPDWRSVSVEGDWYADQPLGGGVFTLNVMDPVDADIATGVCDPLRLRGTGVHGEARYILEVMLEADAGGFDPLHDELLASSPIAYWRLGSISAASVVDEMGGHHGTAHNGVSFEYAVPFRCDTAAQFDGSNDYVAIPHKDDLKLNNGTFVFWFRPSDISRRQGLICKDALGLGGGGHLSIRLDTNDVQVRLRSTTASYTCTANNCISRDTWYQVAFSFGSQGMRLYINGSLADTNSYTGGMGTNSGGTGNMEVLVMGMNSSDAISGTLVGLDEPFTGVIDEVAIFSSQLSGTRIGELHAAGAQLPPHTMTPQQGTWRQIVE